jgi:ketosteroid isomerase-like protein
MITLFLQSFLLVVFGIGLFFLWRAAEPPERWLKWTIAAGFLARAVSGQALFWISWTRLPVLRSLQMSGGYWVFAQDAAFYFPQAAAVAEKGLRAIVFYDRGGVSVSYVQLLAFMMALIGHPASAGILLNLFCYFGTMALLVRWGRAQPGTRTAVAVAIAAISLSPSLVLWSLQPLKDSLFQLLFVAFVAACAAWQHAWLADGTWRTRAAAGALLAVVLFLLAGVRWYFAGALVAATSLFLLMVAFTAAERKAVSFAAAAMMIVVLTQSLVLSAGPYIPPALVALLTLRRSTVSFRQTPPAMFAAIEQMRRGFDAAPASTMIRSRPLTMADTASRPATTAIAESAPPPPVFAPSRQFTEADATRIRALLDEQVAAWNRCDVARAMDLYWRSPELEIVDGSTIIHGWERAAEEHGRGCRTVSGLRITGLRLTGAGDTASLSGQWDATTAAGYALTRMFTMTLRRFPNGEWKITREVFPSPVTAAGGAPPRVESRQERLFAGAAALVVPLGLGERLGLFDIGGGRGLLWFAELDTLIFDLALILALRGVFGARAALAWRNPLTWLVLLTMLIVLVPLVYSVSNFGTLFRLREMIYLGLLLIPFGAAEMRSTSTDIPETR